MMVLSVRTQSIFNGMWSIHNRFKEIPSTIENRPTLYRQMSRLSYESKKTGCFIVRYSYVLVIVDIDGNRYTIRSSKNEEMT